MAYLYCLEDGKRRTDALAHHEGEATRVTTGRLIRDDCLCDSCNKRLAKGESAIFLEFSPNSRPSSLDLPREYLEFLPSESRVI